LSLISLNNADLPDLNLIELDRWVDLVSGKARGSESEYVSGPLPDAVVD